MAIYSLLKLAIITDNADFKKKAERGLKLLRQPHGGNPQAVPLMLQAAASISMSPIILWSSVIHQGGNQGTAEVNHQIYHPGKVVLGTAGKVETFAKDLLSWKRNPPPTSAPAPRASLRRRSKSHPWIAQVETVSPALGPHAT